MYDPGFWPCYLLTEGTLKLLPVSGALVATPAQPVVPSPLGMLDDPFQHLDVATYTMVWVGASQCHSSRPLLRFERGMTLFTTPCPYRFHKPTESFPDRLALDNPLATACLGPVVGQSEHGERTLAVRRPLSIRRLCDLD